MLRKTLDLSHLFQGVSSCSFQHIARCFATASTIELPPCDFKPPPYQGKDLAWMKTVRKENLNPALATYYRDPLFIHCGHMQYLFDQTGRRYLDFFAGIVTVSVGHCHPKVNAGLKEQMDRLWHTTQIYLHPKIQEYAHRLTQKLPGKLKVAYFVNSGSEATDLAMLMARLHTKRFDIISLRNAYHGASPYSVGVSAQGDWKYNLANGFGIHHTSNPDVYQGVWGGYRDSPVQSTRAGESKLTKGPGGGEVCSSADLYINQLREVLLHSVSEGRPAAFFAESIQGVGGTVQFPKGYLKKAFELIRENGGVCVSDEVQTGFGRTGDHYWGFEGHDVVPDIVTMAKGIGNGFPLAAVVTTPEVASSMGDCKHFNTFGGNPMACAVGISTMDVIEEENCQERAKTLGTDLMLKLAKLRDEYDMVGDVRGKGLMIGIELVESSESRKPLSAQKFIDIWEACRNYGLLLGRGGRFGNVLRMAPPMCITQADADFSIAVIRKVLEENK